MQVRPFSQPGLGVPLSFVMSNRGEGYGDIYTPNSTMSASGVSPLHVSVSLSNIPNAPVVSLNFTSPIHVSTSTRVVSPSVPTNTTINVSNVVVTGVSSMPFTSSPLFHNF